MDDGTDALDEPAEAERVAGERERVDAAVDDVRREPDGVRGSGRPNATERAGRRRRPV
jgi:hypothetical protein